MSTSENLQAAFAGESQANRKYLAFAEKAQQDGYPQVAKLFRAAAAAETIHAHAHLRVMKGVKTTAENIQDAIVGEGYEFQEMYPVFLKEAEKEKNAAATVSFRNALAVEEVHHGLYQEALRAVQGGADLPQTGVYICPVCGNTVKGKPSGKCAVCGAPAEKFFEVR